MYKESIHIFKRKFYWVRTSVFFRYMVDIGAVDIHVLVSNNVQWSIEKSNFAVVMGQHTKLTIQGSPILKMLLSVL